LEIGYFTVLGVKGGESAGFTHCTSSSSSLRKEYKLGLCENGMLRGIFEPERKKVTGVRRRLNKVEVNLCPPPNIIRIIK
jgi:hypothetical protein